jgi:hypothetical protein
MLPQLKTLRLIAKARSLSGPKKAPGPGKRIKLGKNFDVACRTCTCCKPDASTYKRYFLRKRIDGVRHVLSMTTKWDTMVQHMGWNENASKT